MNLSIHVEPFLAARGYAPGNSAALRRCVLRRFIASVDEMDSTDVLAWWADLAHLAPGSRRIHLTIVRLFIAHLLALGHIDRDPTAAIIAPRVPAAPPVVLRPSEVCAFIDSIPDRRDRAAAALMLGCGLRGIDVCRLRVEDVDLGARVLSVLSKGGKRRLVPMPTATAAAVAGYLEERPAVSGPLIRHKRGDTPITPHTLRRVISAYLTDVGVKRSAWDGRTAHALRRTCATALLDSGATITQVQAVLGHTSLSSTQRYLAVPETRQLVAVVELGPLAGFGREQRLAG